MARPVLPSLPLLLLVAVVALFAAAEVAVACSKVRACSGSSECCSKYGYCGTTAEYCGSGCVNGPCFGTGTGTYTPTPETPTPYPPTPDTPSSHQGGSGWSSFFTESDFNSWFPYRNGFYSFQAFSDAASAYSGFGNSGSIDDQKREIAAFFGNVQQETGGLQYISEISPPNNYCQAGNADYPCENGKSYYGRGALQISWNYNYGECGAALGLNLLADPDQVAQNGGTAFKTALWFWMTRGCHEAILGSNFAGTNRIINGMECGSGGSSVENRVNTYKRFCGTFQVDPGTNLRC